MRHRLAPAAVVAPALAAALVVALSAPPALAQSAQERLDALLGELNALIDQGRARSLADPWFLDDLAALTTRYGETWPRVLMNHTFESQSGTPKPPWQVRQGRMQVDWTRGLRSRVEIPATEPGQPSSGGARNEDVVGAIVGTILEEALGTRRSQPAAPAVDPTAPALAVADVRVTNAFRIEVEMSGRAVPRAGDGGFEVGVFQPSNAGYRLVLTPNADGQGGRLNLLAVSSRGSARVVDGAAVTVPLLGDDPFTLVWSRRPDGRTTVAINGTDLGTTQDRTFGDPFSGVMIVNTGGDWAVRRITIHGTG
ncbi:hypothetical protein [Roseospira goensis]|uniref:Uncharacterized protein n=1 Tax=Roseospira goensis TaxID=391922 RepID=A0A7W6WKA3_9PROT|nr:hypothetical protein [Roseospira goensis]MBB4285373.1 hypothetical protein [Roseospira goensis]